MGPIKAMTKIRKAIEAIKKEKYETAESILRTLWQKASHDAYINYLLGYLYYEFKNPAHSDEKAKRYFRASIAGDKPIENAFLYLSCLERNKEHAKRVLIRGLTFFPNSGAIYGKLLGISANDEKAKLFEEIVEKGLDTDTSRAIMIEYYFQSNDFATAIDLIDKVQTQDKLDRMVLQLFKGICYLENKDIVHALAEFSPLINQDITNALEFAPQILSIVAFSRRGPGSTEEAFKLFAQVPEDFEFVEPYVYGNLQLWINYVAYILEATNFLLKLTRKKNLIARIRAVRALCVVGSEAYRYYPKAKAHKDLVYAHSVLPHVSKYTETLLGLAEDNGDTFSSYILCIELLSSLFGKELDEKADEFLWSFISESTQEIFQRIIDDFERRLKVGEISTQAAVRLFSPLIERLHKEQRYSAVQRLVNFLGDHNAKDVNALFEVAYALASSNDIKRAAKYYELLLKKRPADTAALNNLALIREECGDLQQAEQLLSKAKGLDPDDALVKNNLERIISLRKAGLKFMGMPFKNKQALLRLWESKNTEDKISVTSDELPSLLGLSGDEATSVFSLFIKNKIILPCSAKENIGKKKKYILNPEVRCNISEIENEVAERTPIMEIINDIANDGLSRIGFNQELINTLNKTFSSELNNYLKRDLQEAAFSLLTRSYKTTQVICGSIIEAVLLDRLSIQGKLKYLCKDNKLRSINRMNLDELLFVGLKEKVINEHLYHLAHGLRGYRNLIHPGVEQRGKAISISESNAKLAWDITRKLLKEI